MLSQNSCAQLHIYANIFFTLFSSYCSVSIHKCVLLDVEGARFESTYESQDLGFH